MKKKAKGKKSFSRNPEEGRRRLRMKPLNKKPPKSYFFREIEEDDEDFDPLKDYREEE